MAHSKYARTTMFDWIEHSLEAEVALPTDAQIVERYGFTSTEHARTLLAELADAGKITIRGYGDDRVITLGRSKSAAVGMVASIAPTVKRADPVVAAGAATIAAIVARTKSAVPARIAAEAAIKKPEKFAAPPPREESMPVTKPAAPKPHTPSVSTIVADIHTVFDVLVDQADLSAELAAAKTRAEAAEGRAEAAEAKLAQLKAIFA